MNVELKKAPDKVPKSNNLIISLLSSRLQILTHIFLRDMLFYEGYNCTVRYNAQAKDNIMRYNAQGEYSSMSDQSKRLIALRLKNIRKNRALSLDETAKLTGVSKAMLGQIERQESSPTISKLWQIATGLEVSFSSFLSDLEMKKGHEQYDISDESGMKVRTVFPYQQDTNIEVLDVSLVNYHEQLSTPHSVEVIEHVIVIEGEVELFFDGSCFMLKEGESMRFKADQKHSYKAKSAYVRFHNIISYPSK